MIRSAVEKCVPAVSLMSSCCCRASRPYFHGPSGLSHFAVRGGHVAQNESRTLAVADPLVDLESTFVAGDGFVIRPHEHVHVANVAEDAGNVWLVIAVVEYVAGSIQVFQCACG